MSKAREMVPTIRFIIAMVRGTDCSVHNSDSPVVDIFKMIMELGLDPKREDGQQLVVVDFVAACEHDDVVLLFAQEL
jgi:hypothetical protein